MPSPTQETISSFFENDHREIDAILKRVNFEKPKEALPIFEEFNQRLERHIVWEEEILFPAVGGKNPMLAQGPVRVMRMEHQAIRENKAKALQALREGNGSQAKASTEAMLDVLGDHNVKEEQILYPACDQFLTAEETVTVLTKVGSRRYSP